jgi:CO/xanthine dehydrogenase FAD-binding subunit
MVALLSARLARAAADAIRETIEPSGDLHATTDYRRDVAGVLMTRAVTEAHRRAALADAA